MTDPTRPDGMTARDETTRPAGAVDDLVLAGLVRDVAEGWHLPPRRLDEPTWSDRIDPDRVGRRPAAGWARRLAAGAAVAVGATVVLSLGAVWLGQPRGDRSGVGGGPAATATPSSSARSGATATPGATSLPLVLRTGATPSVTAILVRVGDGQAVVDLTTGTVGDPISTATGGGTLVRRADGTFVCLCFDTDGYADAAYTHATLRFRTYDASARPLGSITLADFTGIPDPRPLAGKDQAQHVATQASISPDGRLGFVGWATRAPPVWHAGVVVVEMASGRVVGRLDLPDRSTGPDDAPVQELAPRIAVSPAGDRLLATATTYRFAGADQVYQETSTRHVAPIDGTSVGPFEAFAPTASCSDGQLDAGIASDGSAWLTCWTNGGSSQTVRRIAPDGSVLGDTLVNATGEGGTSLVAPDGASLWSWAPTTRTLTRVDLRTGQDATSTAPAPATSSRADWLAAVGRWIAPSVGAKVLLDPGIVLSPDGTRIYALGIDREASGSLYGGSSGIFVFDARTLAPIDHWSPVADYISIGVSADGRWVYAAGAPDVDAAGRPAPYSASVTVHDAADGSVGLVAGRLGSQPVTFDRAILP